MVGCLTLGTAFPYGIAALGTGLDWVVLASASSIAAVLGGLLVAFGCAEGPLLRTRAKLDLRMFGRVFRHRPFRATAFGYFGHMWELYALWSLAGVWLDGRFEHTQLVAFAIVAFGALGCVGGGVLSRRIGERKVAMFALIGSTLACLLSGFAYQLPAVWLLAYLLIWGVLVVADSPQFSALAAKHAPPEYTGTALTVQNGLGFLISTVTIQLLPRAAESISWQWAFTLLAIGPVLGVIATSRIPSE
jgi:MFS family permease